MGKQLPTQEYLIKRLEYVPETGKLYWRVRTEDQFNNLQNPYRECKRWNTRYSGKQAMNYLDDGYFRGLIDNVEYKTHRVVWKLVYGTEPEVIDHIDGNSENNSLNNLRSITISENTKNTKMSRHNTTGITGVSWSKSNKAWRAYIGKNDVKHYEDFFEACCWRKSKELEFGYHENHGRIR